MVNNNNKQFFINQIALFGILFVIILAISLLLPFPISLVAIFGVLILHNMYWRRSMIRRMSHMSEAGGMVGSTPMFSGGRGVVYGKEMCHSCYFGFEKKEEAL